MTVTFIGEDPEGRAATNDTGMRRYTRVFKLETTDRAEGPYAVGSHASLPRIGSLYPDDPFAWCKTLDVAWFSGWKGWKVTANYTSERELAEDPTQDPALIAWDSEQFQRPAIFDQNNNAICNSAGDPFDPPNMMDDSRRVVTVTKNLSVVPAWILTYQDAVNNDSFSLDGITIGIGLAKMQRVSVSPVERRNGITFRVVTFQIHLQKNGWHLEPLDAGFREIASGSGTGGNTGLVNILNPGDDEQPSAPVPLDGNGVSLASPSYTNNVFLDFEVYETLAFSSLPLT
jgi:hypothetical protein